MASNAQQLAAKNAARARRLRQFTLQAQREARNKVLAKLREMSSGPFTYKALRAMYAGNEGRGPYSRVAPAPPADPEIINKQSGRLNRGWRVRIDQRTDGDFKVVFWNTSPKYKFIIAGGTGKMRMMERPIKPKVQAYAKRIVSRSLAEAKRRALNV